MEEIYCINHPEEFAKRKCYLCKKNLCKKCIIKKHHHIFCSEDCAKEYKKDLFVKSLKKKAKMPIPLPFLILIIIISFSTLFYIFYIYREELFSLYIYTIKEKIFDRTSNIYKINPKFEDDLYSFKIFTPEKGILLFTSEKNDFLWFPVSRDENFLYSYRIPPPEFGAFLPQNFINLSKSFNKSNLPFKILSLTFDGGSKLNSSGEIINYLIEKKIKTTFFLTGNFMKNYPEIIKKIENYGFEVGNHTLNHLHLTTYSTNFKQETKNDTNFEKLKKELEETNEIYKSITGKNLKNFWRAPYGEYNEEILSWAWKCGYFHIGWSWDSLDWLEEENPDYEKRILKIKELKEKINKDEKWLYGKILLFHLGNNKPEEIKEIINSIEEKNIKIVPVSTLLATDIFYKLK